MFPTKLFFSIIKKEEKHKALWIIEWSLFCNKVLQQLHELKMGVLHIILKVGLPKIILTQISEQKILMWFLSHNIPKRNKLAEKISQKNPEYVLNYSLPCSCS
jgi:hypothetical protein